MRVVFIEAPPGIKPEPKKTLTRVSGRERRHGRNGCNPKILEALKKITAT